MLSALSHGHLTPTRPFNFSPGPATLPESVLETIAAEMLDWHETGVSVAEMSHRSPDFIAIYEKTITDLRALLNVPSHFKILLMQGGGITQNAAIPLNLSEGDQADFILTGSWSEKSAQEAAKYCDVHIAADAKQIWQGYYGIPEIDQWHIRKNTRYVHICSNETVHGVEFQDLPDIKAITGYDIPLVLDASSHILSRPIDWSRVGVVFAGAQKNIGIAGLTLVFVRDDLLGKSMSICPSILDYANMSTTDSMYNTPPTFAIYVAGLIFEWIKANGGIEQMQKNALIRAHSLYSCIDNSNGFYRNPVEQTVRSRMNVPFFLKDEQLNSLFIQTATQHNLINLKGHKTTGGMRASLYNAMSMQGVSTLTTFMNSFAKQHG